MFSIEKIAQACHEVNRAYCEALGDTSQSPWPLAANWQRQSAIDGVIFVIDRINAGQPPDPSAQHVAWMDQKLSQGWTLGSEKDAVAKTHPCLVPYDELPAQQRAKDKLFLAVVMGML